MTKEQIAKKVATLMTQKEVAATLGVSLKTVIQWNTRGAGGRTLKKIRMGGRVFYRPDDVDAFMNVITGEK